MTLREFVESYADSFIFSSQWYINTLKEQLIRAKSEKSLGRVEMKIRAFEYEINEEISKYDLLLAELKQCNL